ncbi:MAG: hypothetical protein JRJ58_14735, partial [Deltaproteobacteria bacterium]|nr:hypothetical protein [Deltaproteobacteria bacterium]
GEAAGEAVLATILGTLGAISIAATALLWIAAPNLVASWFPNFPPETQALTVKLTRIVLPAQIFFLTGGLLRAVLMAHGRFGAQALAPLVYNGATIAGGLLTGNVEGFAWGVLVGAFIGNWLIPIVAITRVQSIRARFAPFDAHFRAYLSLALPLMLGVSLVTVDEWYEKFFGGGSRVALALEILRREPRNRSQPDPRAHADQQRRSGRPGGGRVSRVRHAAGRCGLSIRSLHRGRGGSGRFAARHSEPRRARLGRTTDQCARAMLLGTGIALLALPVYYAMGQQMGAQGLARAGVLAISLNALATLVWARLRFGGPELLQVTEGALRSGSVALVAAVAGDMTAAQVPLSAGAWGELLIGGGVFVATALILGRAVGEAGVCGVILRRFTARRRREPEP